MRIEVLSSGSEAGNSYWVSDGQTNLLLDCGIRRKQIAQALRERGLPGIDAVLVTHEHQDHARAVKELLRIGQDVYMSLGTARALGVEGQAKIIGPLLENEGCYLIGSWNLAPFPLVHDAAEPLGFALDSEASRERLCYITDTQYIPPAWGNGCTHLLLEANYSLQKLKENVAAGTESAAKKHRVLWNHQSIDTVLKFLRETDRSRLQEVVLLHLSDSNSDEAAFKKAVEELCGCRVRVA